MADAKRDIGVIRFNPDSAQHIAAACVYATIIQSIGECVLLLSQPTITVGSVVRSVAESHADLCAIAKDAQYANHMTATFYAEKVRHLKSMIRNPTDEFHADTAQHIDASSELPKVQADLDKLKGEGCVRLSQEDRFKRAELTGIFESFYWQLCLEAHNNLVVLERRHVVKESGGDVFQLVPVKPNTLDELAYYIDALVGILFDSTLKTHTFLATEGAERWQARQETVLSFRGIEA